METGFDLNLHMLQGSISEAFRPEQRLMVSEWADKYRFLSTVSSPEPGRWRTERTPYLKEIMDCLSSDSEVREVIFKKGSQVGGSEAGLNWIAYLIDHCPGPAMLVQPTEGLAKKFSRQRLDRIFKDCPKLKGKIREKKSRDSSNTAIMKEYDGGFLVIAGANSAVGLRSTPVKFLMLDEVDGYPQDIKGEGDPVKLAEARTRNFPKKKIFKISSPTIDKRSRIDASFKISDQRFYNVPCPYCDEFQKIEWGRIKWENNNPDTAHMVCQKCNAKIEEHHKTKMLAKGKWIAENSKAPAGMVGFHLSALYSPLGWYSWKQAAKEFMEAQGNELLLRVFVNTVLGETWKQKGEAPEWQRLYERRETYSFNKVPVGGLFLTAAVDVQKDRFECEILAWGEDKQSWSIDYRVIDADTTNDKSYAALEGILNETFPVENSKARMPIRLMAVDSGFNTQAVYQFARTKPGRVVATKGSSNTMSIVGTPSPVEVSYAGRKIPRGVKVWSIGVDIIKAEIYGWLQLPKPTNETESYSSGYCHFPMYNDEFFKMLTAEEIKVKMIRGYRHYVWEKIRDRNEALDCRVMNRAAACIVGLDRFSEYDWKAMKDALKSKEEKLEAAPRAEAVVKNNSKGGIATRKSDYW